MYYSTVLFERAGFSALQAAWMAAVAAAMQGLGVFVLVYHGWADTHGRRKALLRAGKGCEGGQLQRLVSRSFSTRLG